jgi:hypothetical protein
MHISLPVFFARRSLLLALQEKKSVRVEFSPPGGSSLFKNSQKSEYSFFCQKVPPGHHLHARWRDPNKEKKSKKNVFCE